jgi:hypothetical protein
MVSTAITLALPLLRRTPIGRVAWKVSKLGVVAGAGYWAIKTWQSVRGVPANAGASKASTRPHRARSSTPASAIRW